MCGAVMAVTLSEIWEKIETLNTEQRDALNKYLTTEKNYDATLRRIADALAQTELSTHVTPLLVGKHVERTLLNNIKAWTEFCSISEDTVAAEREYHKQKRALLSKLKGTKAELRRLNKELSKAQSRWAMQCVLHDMPQIPPPMETAEEIGQRIGIRTGVYIGWNDGAVHYVGRSINLSARLRSHNVVKPQWKVSVIELSENEIYFAELFYIWLLRPPGNCEGRRTKDAMTNRTGTT